MGSLYRRLLALFRPDRLDRDLEEEMRVHLEMKAEETGDPAAARREFGNPLHLRERSADVWRWRWLIETAGDFRFGGRLLRRNPGFTVAASLSLALGIGATTAVLSLADAILWRPLAVPHPQQLISVYHQSAQKALVSSSWPEYEHYRDHCAVFSGLAAYLRLPMVVRAGGAAEEVRGELASSNFFSVLGVSTFAGRAFNERDPASVAVLSYAYWQQRFNLDPGIIGHVVSIGGRDFTVIGVAPQSFRGVVMDWGGPPALWVPITAYRDAVPALAKYPVLQSWGMQSFLLVGRLRPGIPVERAQAVLSVLSAQVAPLRERSEMRPVVLPLQQARFWPAYRRTVTRVLAILGAVSAMALLIACFNVSNLLLAFASKRRREIAVRLAVGVSRGRLLRQLLAESLLVALLGGIGGVAMAAGAVRLPARFPGAFGAPVVVATGIDLRALAGALLVSFAAAMVFGLAPAIKASRVQLTGALTADRGSGRAIRFSLRNALVAAQVALSLVVLVSAGLAARTLRNALAEDATPDPGRLLLARFDLASRGYDPARARSFYRQLVDRMQAIPGVRGAAVVWTVPLSGMRGETKVIVDESRSEKADRNGVSPGYFKVMGLPVLQGREFTLRDGQRSAPVAIINEQAAGRFWPGQNPLGRRIRLAHESSSAEIIGVVRDGQYGKLREPVRPSVYLPLEQSFLWASAAEVRITGEPSQYIAAIRKEFYALDRDLPLGAVTTWESHREAGLGQERLAAALLGGLGLLSLTLAAVGIYGMVSFAVVRRTREIGIRRAMGAHWGDVTGAVLWGSITPVVAGAGAGGLLALVFTRYSEALLYKVSTTDGLTFGAAILLLILTAVAACYLPARRAARIDPVQALRHE